MSGEQERAERAEKARRLRDEEDLSLRQIADRLGVHHTTIQRDLDPKKKARYGDASKEHRRTLGYRVEQVEDRLTALAHLLGVSDEKLAEAMARVRDRRRRELEALEAGAAELEERQRSSRGAGEGRSREADG